MNNPIVTDIEGEMHPYECSSSRRGEANNHKEAETNTTSTTTTHSTGFHWLNNKQQYKNE